MLHQPDGIGVRQRSGIWKRDHRGSLGAAVDIEAQINTLVRVGLLERSSSESVRFVAKYMVTVIYDMILHSRREDMHKASDSPLFCRR